MRVLVTGSAGQVGREVAEILSQRSAARHHSALDVIAADRRALDVSDRDAVRTCIETLEPDLIINLAAFTNVDACETEHDRAFAVNALGARHVAESARRVDAHVCFVSTDYVFDGTSDGIPYTEWDLPNPMSVYGLSKLAGERECLPGTTIVRTSWVCGRHGQNIVKTILRLMAEPAPLRFVDDQTGCPTLAADLAVKVVDLALARRPGLFHVTNQGTATWFEVAREVVAMAGGDPGRVEPTSTAELARPARRPAYSVLDNAALRIAGESLLSDWRTSMRCLVEALTA